LSDALNGRSGLSVVATAPDHRRALALTEDLHADVAIISMAMPEADLLVQMLAGKPARVVALGPCEEDSVAVVEDGTAGRPGRPGRGAGGSGRLAPGLEAAAAQRTKPAHDFPVG
jgi:chemotaxis response regulator CheB